MTSISARACSSVTPGLSLALAPSQRKSRVMFEGWKASGFQIWAAARSKGPPFGRTPITVCGSPFNKMSRPSMAGSEPKRLSQSTWLSSTTRSLPGWSSPGRNVRPSAGFTPKISK